MLKDTLNAEPPPSLLTVILDTNPHAWALLAPTLPLSTVIANLQVFINAHLAFNNANKIAIIASHCQRAEFLYPQPPVSTSSTDATNGSSNGHRHHSHGDSNDDDDDVEMEDMPGTQIDADANHYRPFQEVQTTLLAALSRLIDETTPESLTPTTAIAGALTLALTYTNKQQVLLSSATSGPSVTNPINAPTHASETPPPSLLARILILSVSGDLALQYIPIMNTIFACQRLGIPIDILKLAGSDAFLQQASDATAGTYIKAIHPGGLLQYLMMAFLPDQTSRKSLISPTQVGVDFRAACFCHRRVVDVGFVCSICLSIFCEVPEGASCLTCGTHLSLGNYGRKPVLVKKKKKKRKQMVDGEINRVD